MGALVIVATFDFRGCGRNVREHAYNGLAEFCICAARGNLKHALGREQTAATLTTIRSSDLHLEVFRGHHWNGAERRSFNGQTEPRVQQYFGRVTVKLITA